MTVTRTVLPPNVNPAAIRNFSPPTGLRGYDRSAVDAFLDEVAASYQQALAELARLRRRVEELESQQDRRASGHPPAGVSAFEQERHELHEERRAIAAALKLASETAEHCAQAEADAAARLAAAHEEAERLQALARDDMARLIDEARLGADEIVQEATLTREAYEEGTLRLQTLHETTRRDLAAFIAQVLEHLRDTPARPAGAGAATTTRGTGA